ncbi:Hpt domain-containing protein [Pseudodesulfovibrio sp. JC047]|uniref:Hpt domain-containing protein n=1 Tax=Pseudodesulfovibrio sp. JC047 TaxID=2683199 RepID=UPI0013CFBF74|nr:Hpt domain-containing protein [Pseudodesulfovibrio sp. JC047]NDV18097.1 Hpt domain-containing protein [Pseudodesulfovibrio sp. JC047]
MVQDLFNKDAFLASLANDRELACELIAAFMEDCPTRNASLTKALTANDALTASKMAHSLKGMCGVVRANELAELALDMELTAKEGRLDLVREQHARFLEMLQHVIPLLNAFKADK